MNQDLSSYPKIDYLEGPDGKRSVSFSLPWPSWTKSTRVAAAKTGGRFLSKASKDYSNYLIQAVIVSEPPARPWLREEYFWEFHSYTVRSDADQHASGLLDDFVVAQLCVDDKYNFGFTVRRTRVTEKAAERIVVNGKEV